jgi:hypothetical protein
LWVAIRSGEPIAFFAGQGDSNGEWCEDVIGGVRGDCAGNGIYTDLIRYTQAFFKARGFGKMHVSTQVHNYAVQNVWAHEGFKCRAAYNTIHINSLLSSGESACR